MTIVKGLWMGLLVGAFGTTAYADAQKVVDIKQVQARIAEEHAGWQAKDNWVSKLSHEEITRMLGLQIPPRGNLDYESASFREELPKILDWRNMNGVNWLGPVMNQGNCGSCVAFASVATLEARTSIFAGIPWLHPTYSPQALFACGGGGCNVGWIPDRAAEFLTSTGVPDEACMPYTSGSTGEDVACQNKCADARSRTVKILGSTMPTSYGGNVEVVKKALQRGPLVTTLMVYADFLTYSSGIYKHVTGSALGGHAVSLVGYDSNKRAWLIRNSWAKDWGEEGYGWISWDDRSGIGADTWDFRMGNSQEYLSVITPDDRAYVSGKYSLLAQSKSAKNHEITFHLKNSEGREVMVQACLEMPSFSPEHKGCASEIDTTLLKDGRYEVYADSVSSTDFKSQVREFFVINSTPQMSLSFTGASGTNLSAPLKGRAEFIIKARSIPVPMQHLEFRIYDTSGKLVSVKSNDYVMDNMKMGWRTTANANGSYKIQFHGETKYQGKIYSTDSDLVSVTVAN